MLSALVTAPPYASFLPQIAAHPLVRGLRLNTVMPLHETPAQALERLSRLGQPLWVDLKGRQLRVLGAAIPPYTEIFLSHPIEVQTPVTAWLGNGAEALQIAAVEGNRLILEDGPHRLIGPGESINIPHPSLRVLGTLTATDRAYLEAMRSLGLCRVMLSYTESPADVEEIRALLPEAELILKIESLRGLEYARQYANSQGRLMAARGDLFLEVGRPHRIIPALRDIFAADPQAIVASRLFPSLAYRDAPESADIGDAAFLLTLGYRTFLLGDALCFQRQSVLAALNLLESLSLVFP